MSRTRDIQIEIEAVRSRRRFGEAMTELPIRLAELELAFRRCDTKDAELIRYFPVAIVACAEGYFRLAIKDLVDAGEPFLGNAEKISGQLKIDFALLRAIHGRQLTVGELVAHAVSLSRLEHVDGTLSAILGEGFLGRLRTTVDRWETEVRGKPSAPILSNPDAIYRDVARTFELRHIICHEIASAHQIDREEVERCFLSFVLFLRASDEAISEVLHPDAPLTQSDMNVSAGRSLAEAETKFQELLNELGNSLADSQKERLNALHAEWLQHADRLAELEADSIVEGGTMWPTVYAGSKQSLNEQRIKELAQWKRALGAH